MAIESNVQQPLTRRELRELERQAEREALAAKLAAEAAAKAEADKLAAAKAAKVAAAEAAAAAVVTDEAPVFLSRRERREAERAAATVALEKLEAASAAATAQVAAKMPQLFAETAAPVEAPVAPVAPAPVVTAPVESVAPAAPTASLAPVISLDEVRAARVAAFGDVPTAPIDEPELEVAAAFARQGRETSATRGRRIMLSNRRNASASRFGGSMLAMSFLAGTVVLGAGSATAIGVMGSQQAEAEAEQLPEATTVQHLSVAVNDTSATVANRDGEATAVTAIGTAAAANLATGVKLPDATAFTNNITANVQWPFPMGVQITDTFGPRVSPTWGASGMHGGVDFTPGEGTPVGSIADGVVLSVDTVGNSSYGVVVQVQHVINGVTVTSVYAHLQSGSVTVAAGQTVSVGDELGKVGNTGLSTGPHLHLEIQLEGKAVDPLYFLQKFNVAGVDTALPTSLVNVPLTNDAMKMGVADSHALIESTFGQ
ncbi:M23 family metallopeptidase [Gulosibacter macacae]|uniref:M23 family metallopeptidase n=1 Tax=Gulosibacter macacae TaxID=2488791 RepID=A0A3P3VU58_9MICO|nr:M23 family metallopeptidase [Gulosibacter macacae]RRJ85857.1 M23 family metallopeptidase [Gulosibacter macacae]